MEKDEILSLCDEIIENIDKAIKEYKSSKNWGMFDMFGGGSLASIFKHRKIKKARQYSEKLDKKLAILKNELKYLDDFNIEKISGFNKFVDIAFDNIFSDIFVQGKIKDAISKLYELKYSIEDVKNSLNN